VSLIGVRGTAGQAPDGFAGNGYEIPVIVAKGQAATLSSARSARPYVRFAYSPKTASRARRDGVGGAPVFVHFEACSDRRTGFEGGIIVRRPGCYPVVLRQKDRDAIHRRIPLGRACPAG
jgi:hypothetical protein